MVGAGAQRIGDDEREREIVGAERGQRGSGEPRHVVGEIGGGGDGDVQGGAVERGSREILRRRPPRRAGDALERIGADFAVDEDGRGQLADGHQAGGAGQLDVRMDLGGARLLWGDLLQDQAVAVGAVVDHREHIAAGQGVGGPQVEVA